jgi:predicted aminopeptidase
MSIFWWSPEENEDVLKDPKIEEKYKEKIRKIEVYKKHFYTFFEKKPTDIYTETVFLKGETLTYLVIVSPHDAIRAREFSFPFFGSFPYIGFYKKKSAEKFMKKMHEDDYVTYMRNVDAYSTLGRMDDPILSTFFKYDDYDLARLIFHELFHTIFFVEGDVQLNENLAQYFADKMAAEYFQKTQKELDKEKKRREKINRLKQEIVYYAKLLNKNYAMAKFELSKKDSDMILQQFLHIQFKPGMRKLCRKLGLKKKQCFPLKYNWNNATFASFMTYEEKRNLIEEIHAKHAGSLLDFYHFIEKNYKIHQDEDYDIKFSKFLYKKVK